ncbi:phospholipase A2 inhibitor and Ly6/PLAUR domain-containing protein-like isoform X1 [Ambystoma mexicanum]|uniref:phospholipase A2 inhibitor and Ly6/PLAUR domain-containing protein-like isoform X1 n=1 Tax=Ambystoma mexicanum TaxID=8296 RepID=UPI0037E73B2F
MRMFLTAVAVLFAVITEGNSLICEHCAEMNAESCSGVSAACPDNVTHCVKGLQKSKQGPYVNQLAFKGCLDPSKQAACGKEVVFRGTLMSLWITRACCDSDSCNSGDIQALPILQTPNGFHCPDCSPDQSATGCTAVGDIPCVGHENQCGNFTGNAARAVKTTLLRINSIYTADEISDETLSSCKKKNGKKDTSAKYDKHVKIV